ncbi:hypothetical protein DL93DRAFT_2225083 [Clavulina sp. PMI_390]|nr:hypothetical protein DL93DRAFT_2225083 [Clavulina sp. PMI_390]
MASILSPGSAAAAKQHNAAQPVLSLPVELLVEIFALNTPIFAQPAEGPRRTESEWSIEEYEKFRLAVSGTCSEFRSVVTYAPRCWTLVRIRLPAGRITGATSPPALQAWLERSFPLAFDLAIGEFDTGDDISGLAQGHCEVLANTLKTHLSSRCRSITFSNSDAGTYHLPSLSKLFADAELSQVAHFVYCWSEPRGDDGFVSTILSKLTAPLLSLCVAETRVESPFFTELASSVFSSITRLQILAPGAGLKHISSFVEQCHMLEHLDWIEVLDLDDLEDVQDKIVFPRLRSMRLDGTLIVALPAIEAPLLETILLENYDGPCFLFRPEQKALPALRRISELRLGPLREPNADDLIRNFFHRQPLIEDLYLGPCSVARLQIVVDALLEVSSQSAPRSSIRNTCLKRMWFCPSFKHGGLDSDGDSMLAGIMRSLDHLSTSDLQISLYPAVLRDPFDFKQDEVSLSQLWPQTALVYANNPSLFHHERPNWDWQWQWLTPWFQWHLDL